ncbi:hypothetical protein J6590_065074 [Homalodisca vitripennis]|nr:hypothetical protein J6590_065074 [Homalodisca vitripennis]
MTVVVNDESKHSTFSRINIVICFIPCGGPTVICFIPCGSRAADPLDGHHPRVIPARKHCGEICPIWNGNRCQEHDPLNLAVFQMELRQTTLRWREIRERSTETPCPSSDSPATQPWRRRRMRSSNSNSLRKSEMKKHKHKFRNKPESNRRTGVKCVCGCVVAVVCIVLCVGVGVDAKAAGTGGEVYGDPAPGRSPGPPKILFKAKRYIWEDSRLSPLTSDSSSVTDGTFTSKHTQSSGVLERSSGSPRKVPVSSGKSYLPGRLSAPPGRTRVERSISETFPQVLLDTAPVEAPWCEDYSETLRFTPGSPNDIVLNLTHPLFDTEVGIVPGTTYNVVLMVAQQVRDFSLVSLAGGGSTREEFNREDCLRPLAHRPEASSLSLNFTLPHAQHRRPNNATFRIRYRLDEMKVFESYFHIPILTDCKFRLKTKEGNLSSSMLPDVFRSVPNCSVEFPRMGGHSDSEGLGLVVSLTRLNVHCALGRLRISPAGPGERVLCGKLEEISTSGREMYFRFDATPVRMYVVGTPVFSISYHLVDYCFNVTYTHRNHSFDVNPSSGLLCNYRILLPYGNRVSLNIRIGKMGFDPVSERQAAERLSVTTLQPDDPDPPCSGFLIRLWDGPTSWTHCAVEGDPVRELHVISRENRVGLRVTSRPLKDPESSLKLSYDSIRVPEIVQQCEWGWVAVKQFCVQVVEDHRVSWQEAEQECVRRAGHLVSIRSEQAQTIIDNLLLYR